MGTNSKTAVDPLWTVEDVSTYLKIPVKTLYQWHWRGQGPPAGKVGRYLRYEPAAVREWFLAMAA